jgi:RNA polymerase subunit RPABC4/transcription elongation factor Spt4
MAENRWKYCPKCGSLVPSQVIKCPVCQADLLEKTEE